MPPLRLAQTLSAPFDGVVAERSAELGGQVSEGAPLVKLDAA